MKINKDWIYLENMNYNLLYEYANAITNDVKYLGSCLSMPNPFVHTETKQDVLSKNSLYLLNFIFKYIAKCDTLEECLNLINSKGYDAFNKIYLTDRLAGYIYIGTQDFSIKVGENNLKCIIEMIYTQADFIEQLEIFIKKADVPTQKRNKAKELLNLCNRLMNGEAG